MDIESDYTVASGLLPAGGINGLVAGQGQWNPSVYPSTIGGALLGQPYVSTPYPSTSPTPIYTDGGIYSRCSRDAHYFGCKHETSCECGMTSRRLDLAVSDGL